jgi:hypothetical protein
MRSRSMDRKIALVALCYCALAVAGCENKGPMERAGEKVDETARTIQNGGQKTPSDKVKDAAQDVKNGAENAVDDVKK